ncbi:MAG: transglutaminaseTgpA domain-containing protein, partial [Pseudomonadota bacterium]
DTAATSGVSDELAPGGITELGLSDELAFRVGFEGDSPEPRRLYWRGLALDQFDDGRWRRSRGSLVPTRPGDLDPGASLHEEEENAPTYELIMEPTGQRWIYSLAPLSTRDSDIGMDGNLALYAERSILQRERFRLAGLPPPDSLPGLADGSDRRRALRLPESGEPRTRELARQWRRDADDDRAVLERAMEWLRSRPFEYTLQPPAYGDNGLDSFLFDERRGFCGHYASAFTYMMRAAGVPARVVVGYQGGERNPYENYVMVYQYNAHAWVEVWLEEDGWVRVDPTTAVSPDRIELGAQAWLQQYGEQTGLETPGNGSRWFYGMRMQLDRLEYAWNRWVINFDTETQFNLLESLTGQRSERLLRLILVVGLMAMVMVSIALVVWSVRGKRSVFHGTDRVLGGFHRLLEVASRRGADISATTGPLEASMAMSRAWPRLSSEFLWVGDRVIDCCYAQREAVSGRDRLKSRLRLRWTMYLLRWKLRFSRPQTCC